MGVAIICALVELLVQEILRDRVCKLSFKKMVMTFSSKSDEIRVRDMPSQIYPIRKKKTP